jgi:hypothetical protein
MHREKPIAASAGSRGTGIDREDPQAWRDYVSELRRFEHGTARDGLSGTG